MKYRVCSLIRMQPPANGDGLLFASGLTVPTDGTRGYRTGCTFQHTDGTTNDALYVNEGSVTSCAFVALEGSFGGPNGITLDGTGTTALNITGTFTTVGINIANTCTKGMQIGATADGAGIVMDTSTTRAVGIYAELAADAGSGYLVRPLRCRLRVDTGGTTETETYGIQGQHCVYASNLGHWHGGVLGTLERSSGTVRVYNPLAGAGAVIGRIGGNITVDTGGWLAGIIALNLSTVTLTSGVHAGVYVTKAAGSDWSHGVYVEDATTGVYVASGATLGLDIQAASRVGTHDWGVGATGIQMTAGGMLFQTAGRITTDTAAGAYSAGYNQLAVTAALTGNVSSFASWNELYFTGTTAIGTGNAASVWGHIEISGTFTGPASTSNYMGSVVGTLMSDANTVTNSGIMGAFIADSVLTSGFTNNAVIAAFVAHVNASHPTRANWPMALYIDGADVAFGFGSGTNYEDGCKVNAGAVTPGANGSVAVKIDVGGTAYYLVGYAAGELSGE